MDFDPRDYDSRDEERWAPDRRSSRGNTDEYERDDDRRQPEIRSRDREDGARTLGRGLEEGSRSSDEHPRDRDYDARWPDRDRDARKRDVDPRDVFTRALHLPRGLEREIVRDRDREYTLRGSESRTLHERLETTHQYIEADLALKEKALQKLTLIGQSARRFKADAPLLAFLASL